MKHVKHILAAALTLFMAFALAVPAWAAESSSYTYTGTDATTNGQININNATKGTDYTLYKIFDATYDANDATKVSYTIKDGALKTELAASGADYFTIGATWSMNVFQWRRK